MRRLTDNDHNFGPLTIGYFRWNALSIYLTSGGDDEDGGGYRNALHINAFNWSIRLLLPNFIRPFREWVECPSWDEATVSRLGRSGYWKQFERRYGLGLYDGDHFVIRFGVQEGFDNLPRGVKESRKAWFLPWKQWRMVRHSLYDRNGDHFHTEPDRSNLTGDARFAAQKEWWAKRDECPRVEFWFEDHDGEIIKASTYIEEREWLKGEGSFKWVSWFCKPMIRRDLEMSFSREIGKEKGSWKGGIMATGIQMLPGELHEEAFRRYCKQEHRAKSGTFTLKFLGTQEPTLS